MIKFCLQILAISTPAIFYMGCQLPERSEIVGTYVNNHPYAYDTMYVNDNGTYVNNIYLKSEKKKYVNKGNWAYEDGQVHFHDYANYIEQYGVVGMKGVWISNVDEKNGRIALVVSSDEDFYFSKIDP